MRKKVLSLEVTSENYLDFIDNIIDLSSARTSSYVCVANVHMCIEAHNDAQFREVVNNADLVTPDGMPLVFALKKFYGIHQQRVAGMDLLPDLLTIASQKKLNVFFYGGTTEMLRTTEAYISLKYPTLENPQYYSPPFRELTSDEEYMVIDKINSSGTHIVFVALGCPKQERWMAKMKGRINACMVGIGGALPVMVGLQKRAPIWMQKIGLEWFFRLLQEPKRLFKRYFITNSLFIYLFLKEYVSLRLIRKTK